MTQRSLLITVGVLAASGYLVSGSFVVQPGEIGLVKRFGDPVRTCIDPGLGMKYPWPIDTLVRFDNRLTVLESPAPGEPAKEYLTQDEQAGIGRNVIVTTYTCWRIKPDPKSVLTFLETMGDHASAAARLGDVVVSELGAALGRNDFSMLISTDPKRRGWVEFMDSTRDRCRQRVEEEYGIEIVDIRIQRLNFPDQNRRNVFDRMRAERETIASRYRSEGEEQATRIRARANREREEILAKANMEAEQIRSRADAEAARIYAEAYDQDREFYEFVRTLEAYEKTFDEQTVTILSADSEFLRLLNRAARPTRETMAERSNESQRPTTQPAQPE
ncbi:MAG: protease modulator HflC [Phycisphaerae bacterium]